jgi:hypothetical protein
METLKLDLTAARTAANGNGIEPITGSAIAPENVADEDAFTAWINKALPAVLCVAHHAGTDEYEVSYFG